MSARFAFTSMVIVLLSACSVEDENPTERCSADLTCSDELVCYRGFCVDRGEAIATVDDAGQVTTPSPGREPRDASASVVGPRDAGGASASDSADAARAASVEQSSVEQPSPAREAAQDAASERPTPMPAPAPADAGVAAPTTPAPMTQPMPDPGTQPMPDPVIPEAMVPSPGTPSTWLTDLVELGFLPVQVLNCVPKCLTLEPAKECDQCLEKALQGEGKKVECDDNGRGRGNRASCVVRECADDDDCEK